MNEYVTKQRSYIPDDAYLTHMSKLGWELVSITVGHSTTFAIFRRESNPAKELLRELVENACPVNWGDADGENTGNTAELWVRAHRALGFQPPNLDYKPNANALRKYGHGN